MLIDDVIHSIDTVATTAPVGKNIGSDPICGVAPETLSSEGAMEKYRRRCAIDVDSGPHTSPAPSMWDNAGITYLDWQNDHGDWECLPKEDEYHSNIDDEEFFALFILIIHQLLHGLDGDLFDMDGTDYYDIGYYPGGGPTSIPGFSETHLPELYPCEEGAAVPFIESNCFGQEIATCKPDGVSFAGFFCVGESAPGYYGDWYDIPSYPPHPGDWNDHYPMPDTSSPSFPGVELGEDCPNDEAFINGLEFIACEAPDMFVFVDCTRTDDDDDNDVGIDVQQTCHPISEFGDVVYPEPDDDHIPYEKDDSCIGYEGLAPTEAIEELECDLDLNQVVLYCPDTDDGINEIVPECVPLPETVVNPEGTDVDSEEDSVDAPEMIENS